MVDVLVKELVLRYDDEAHEYHVRALLLRLVLQPIQGLHEGQ
jgi:hypothetical protein